MAQTAIRSREKLYVPEAWVPRAPSRDVGLDLLRGLAMVIILLNHTKLDPGLGYVTRTVLSAAEVLVGVSGVVVGVVFGRRWLEAGGRATAGMLLRRARKLYLASVVVVALVGAATLVPWLGADALTVSPNMAQPVDSYAYDGILRTLLAIVTLEAGPWQFNILGFFVASLAFAPLLLWALARGGWPVVLIASWALYLIGREWHGDVLPSQSERAFPLLVWQLLFVNGMVIGWHRARIASWAVRHRRALSSAVVALAVAGIALQVGGLTLLDPAAWDAWKDAHFHKGTLDPLRLLAMTSIALGAYLVLRHRTAERVLGPVLLPLGRNSFYVFIVHVFLCLALASIPALADADSLGFAGNVALQLACVALVWAMVRRRVLFRWIPR
jgi:hypothetical protein